MTFSHAYFTLESPFTHKLSSWESTFFFPSLQFLKNVPYVMS